MKDKILKTTAKLIAKNGVNATSTRLICSELGITAPTLYYYFADKNILLAAVTDHSFDRHFKKIGLTAQDMDPVALLQASWDAYMEFVVEDPELFSIMIASILRGEVPASGVKCYEKLIEIFESPALQNRLNHSPAKSASIYLSAAQGSGIFAVAQKRADMDHETRDAVLKTLIKNYLLQ